MTEAGLNKIHDYIKEGKLNWKIEGLNRQQKNHLSMPLFIENALKANEPAFENFNNLAQGYQQNYIQWIMAAKTDKTTQKRLNEAIELLKDNKKLGLK
jgi:uncharacterized protein YdeI (YjbR/CyaY-like superfamily)